MRLTLQKPDIIGAIASILCIVHCAVTPFLFLAHSSSMDTYQTTPVWWKNIDYLFLIISFVSIYHSTKTSGNKIIKQLLWISWSLLFLLIMNEKLTLFSFPEIITYTTAISLAFFHLYNLKYCQCKNDNCCVRNK
jgi:hypothetical protein